MKRDKRSSPLKRRNPQDSTRRNVQAGNKRDAKLTAKMLLAEQRIQSLKDEVQELDYKVKFILGIVQRDVPVWPKWFASEQRKLGYRHSTSFPASIRVKG